jgi:hypothetical protein
MCQRRWHRSFLWGQKGKAAIIAEERYHIVVHGLEIDIRRDDAEVDSFRFDIYL